ncbi:fatty acid-binding protein, heart-like [Babylonia areolata]|uniref:fatty acid-binding protein, heart-like n=1 Tax=Babylonia areolata TaxID=304850 RepID=UPI003FD584E8
MADSFIGKWKVDVASTTGLEEFGAAIGFSEERMTTYRKLVYTIEFSVAGDTYTATVSFEADIPAQTYAFKMGEAFDYKSIDGTSPKLTITMDGGKMVEDYKLGEKEWRTIRQVDGSVMTSTTSFADKAIVQKLNKQ